jgi:hypothetical protein
MEWEKINEMFPEGFAYTTNGPVSVEEILTENYKSLSLLLSHPSHDITKEIEEITWYSNGDMTRNMIYHIYPEKLIDGMPPLNYLGQIVFNDYIKDIVEKKELI